MKGLKMCVQLLISTMMQNDFKLLDRMNVMSDAVVINQCNKDGIYKFKYKNHSIIWINTKERGLSKSRNMAITYAWSDYCVLADDDEVFCEGYVKMIENSFIQNKNYSVICFMVNGIERKFKEYSDSRSEIGYINSLKISSVEIAFKRSEIIKNTITFNELIGAGTENLMGEENAFVFSCLKKHLKICYEPLTIARLHLGDSTWFKGFDKKYFLARGAAFTAMTRLFSVILILQFGFRKYRLYKEELTLINAYKYMFKGRREYIKLREESETIKE